MSTRSDFEAETVVWPLSAVSNQESSRSSRDGEVMMKRRLRRIHNEFRDNDGLLSLWPERYDDQRVSSVRLEVIPDFEDVVAPPGEDSQSEEVNMDARSSVRKVLAKHLQSFEKGSVSLAEAYNTTGHYRNGEWKFEAGDLVEYRGLDLRWHLGYVVVSTGDASLDRERSDEGQMISGILGLRHSQANNNNDIGYAVVATEGFRAGFGTDGVPKPRPSSKMLRALFGPTPFRFQQQLLLEAENRAVHRKSSPADFQAVCWADFARIRWQNWLKDPENSHFRHFHDHDVPNDGARAALFDLIIEPFELLDEINDWELDREKLSPYLYFGCLGSGLLLSAIVLLVQVGTAATLFAFQIQQSATKSEDLDEDNRRAWARQDGVWPCRHRSDGGPMLSSIMVTLISVYYLFKIVPDMFSAVTGVMGFGSSDPGIAKLVNLRRLISISDEDTLKMKIGFRIYLTLNTAFDCCLYILNLYLLWLTRDAVEILLNSLAIEFIQSLDESFCTSTWFDPNARYIKASAFEMVLRQFLDVHAIEDAFYPKSHGRKKSGLPQVTETQVASHPPPKREVSEFTYPKNVSHFVRNQLDSQLTKLYGDDQAEKRKMTQSSLRFFFSNIAGFQSLLLGRYKLYVFNRWERYRDWNRWRRESLDFSRNIHIARINSDFDQVELVYGDIPAFPSALDKFSVRIRHSFSTYFRKYTGVAHFVSAAVGYKLFCAGCNCNPFTGSRYSDPTPDASQPFWCFSAKAVRYLINMLDASLEFVSTWAVLIFPLIVIISVFYFPICY